MDFQQASFGNKVGILLKNLSAFSFRLKLISSEENQCILASWCSSLLSNCFARIKRYFLVSSDTEWPLDIIFDFYRCPHSQLFLCCTMTWWGTSLWLWMNSMALIHYFRDISYKVSCSDRIRILRLRFAFTRFSQLLSKDRAIFRNRAISVSLWRF